jgi:two-component system, NtrC family, sensor kinase
LTVEVQRRQGVHPPGQPEHARTCVSVEVRDEGEGIAPEVLPHIFDPFFTTRDVGEGTGLGLAVSYGIAQEHGGWIEVQSELGQGSAFRVFLPAEAEP